MPHDTATELVVLAFVMANVAAQLQPSPHLRSEAAFLQQIVQGLPADQKAQLYLPNSTSGLIVRPDETGVSHFVFPGFIPKHLLGRQSGH